MMTSSPVCAGMPPTWPISPQHLTARLAAQRFATGGRRAAVVHCWVIAPRAGWLSLAGGMGCVALGRGNWMGSKLRRFVGFCVRSDDVGPGTSAHL